MRNDKRRLFRWILVKTIFYIFWLTLDTILDKTQEITYFTNNYILYGHFYVVQSLISLRTWDTFPYFQVPEQLLLLIQNTPQENIYILKVNNANTRKRCEICSKLPLKTPDRFYWRHSGIFIVNFEHISHLSLMFVLLTFNMLSFTGPGGIYLLVQSQQ